MSLAMIFLIVCSGIIGFIIIEHYSFLDAFYMTIITVATVGFEEVHPLSADGRLFTAFLIIMSFGTFAFAVSSISKYVVDGEFKEYFKHIKVSGAIEKLEGHVIICGFGRNGKQAAHVLKKHNTRFVVVEEKKEVVATITHRHSDLVLEGDATHDEVLERAGI
jgi:voltage-gated potassium channel